MLPGIAVRALTKIPDERGFFMEALRADWRDLLGDDAIVQANLSLSHPGVVRAWHRHARGQVDYFLVLAGWVRICAFDDAEGSPTRGQVTEVTSSGEVPQLVRVPGHYWHGTMTLGAAPSLTVYFTTRLYDHASPDEERRPWNDPAVPYDWLRPVHR
ncbi:MAG: dTDP-4-dehydrorhamnose 3,5-epimerase family protein [Armatimonadota bacterium]|nr:dTDP-4-dehydrorhamnose 3,5-epimerase family protein [Armatimonadota bacterium]MDR7454719.1 dTDP-4-dehydrorhamnose 3,5-epimerase family protein [Armatimonadota bacterium]MDR7457320.1 dTDP-4-dehydrorhamnose 3,5-epimerase family protein [Armatimonadota bacterium]MDR7512275.1 dTDP-4-dehydrorhamnose 3,5-epimerase family protein [Armatimonadota bacterium]